jgi:hypothetical protein
VSFSNELLWLFLSLTAQQLAAVLPIKTILLPGGNANPNKHRLRNSKSKWKAIGSSSVANVLKQACIEEVIDDNTIHSQPLPSEISVGTKCAKVILRLLVTIQAKSFHV